MRSDVAPPPSPSRRAASAFRSMFLKAASFIRFSRSAEPGRPSGLFWRVFRAWRGTPVAFVSIVSVTLPMAGYATSYMWFGKLSPATLGRLPSLLSEQRSRRT